jgi:lambda repressor-like predicted transcriptional regulator
MDQTTRVRRPRRRQHEIAQLISEYSTSGLSRAAFCRKHQLSLATLARYLQRAERLPIRASFVAVEIATTPADGGLALALPGGRRLTIQRGFCPDTLRQVLSVLERG